MMMERNTKSQLRTSTTNSSAYNILIKYNKVDYIYFFVFYFSFFILPFLHCAFCWNINWSGKINLYIEIEHDFRIMDRKIKYVLVSD